ncbi:uncharacterized protein LOC133777573 [Humulus lupulus]|uniref:uncharacterized protein LOC133777573 n=1 Tax=Humulus lupulus TaxID=3486 RepID=UPI002B408E76|nr:uncharacterized protein LOC133777573 [Humulus lupulus]
MNETAAEMAGKEYPAEAGSAKIASHWWWAAASVGQLGWGIASVRKGCAEHSTLMPLKAFAVASLFVGALASASFAGLRTAGIHKVEDLIKVGGNTRTGLGVRPRARDE